MNPKVEVLFAVKGIFQRAPHRLFFDFHPRLDLRVTTNSPSRTLFLKSRAMSWSKTLALAATLLVSASDCEAFVPAASCGGAGGLKARSVVCARPSPLRVPALKMSFDGDFGEATEQSNEPILEKIEKIQKTVQQAEDMVKEAANFPERMSSEKEVLRVCRSRHLHCPPPPPPSPPPPPPPPPILALFSLQRTMLLAPYFNFVDPPHRERFLHPRDIPWIMKCDCTLFSFVSVLFQHDETRLWHPPFPRE